MTLRRKSIRFVLWTLAVLFVLLVATVTAMTWVAHQNRRRAEALLHDIQSLRIGESSATDALRIVQKYGGKPDDYRDIVDCGTEGTHYHMDITNDYGLYSATISLESSLGVSLLPLLGSVGYMAPPLWAAGASVTVEAERTVCSDFHLYVYRTDGVFLLGEVKSAPPSPPRDVFSPHPAYFGPSEHPAYFASTGWDASPGVEMLHVNLTHKASPEERRRAFDINLGCLTRMFDQCRRVCELMPSAWTHEARTNPDPKHDWPRGISDPRCRALLTP